jgi:hypothetical protein
VTITVDPDVLHHDVEWRRPPGLLPLDPVEDLGDSWVRTTFEEGRFEDMLQECSR